MKIFSDKELSKEIQTFDLGTLDAGDNKEYIYYILNDNKDAILDDISFKLNNSEVSFIKYPKRLNPNESSEIILKWESSVDIKKALKINFDITGYEIYKPGA